MEFWGVEVKPGETKTVDLDFEELMHLSQAALGESNKDSGNEPVTLFVTFNGQKLVLGTLSHEKFPQISFDVVFESNFELSHNSKNGSVYFCGYKNGPTEEGFGSDSDSEEEEEEEVLPLKKSETGKPSASLPKATGKPKAEVTEPKRGLKPEESDEEESGEEDETDEDDESGEEGGSEEGMSLDEDDDEDDESESEDEETPTPKKVQPGKKRSNESATKTPIVTKKAKSDTPQKTDGKKGEHTATPHPKKGAANGNKSQQTLKSGGQLTCNSCKKAFGTEVALQSHSKAKHGGK